MIPHTINIYSGGSYNDIHDCENVYLHCERAEVHVDKKPVMKPEDGEEREEEPLVKPSDIEACLNRFTDGQVKASGIRCQPRVALALMAVMQPRCTQKVDWLSFYCVLLGRGWVDANVTAYARMVNGLFGVSLDQNTLNRTLSTHGTDYMAWTDADKRIVRRKELAADFDARLTEYFERGRSAVLEGIK